MEIASLMHIKFCLFSIVDCGCNTKGFSDCTKQDGQCKCYTQYKGAKCFQCSNGYYKMPDDSCQGILCFLKFSSLIFIFLPFWGCEGPINVRWYRKKSLSCWLTPINTFLPLFHLSFFWTPYSIGVYRTKFTRI